MHQTDFDLRIKGIDYASEEYAKQVLVTYTSSMSAKLSLMSAFIGCVRYPGKYFRDTNNNVPTTQFQNKFYIGLMDMIFPDAVSDLAGDGLPSFTVLQLNLDGELRTFVTIAGGDIVNGLGVKFSDYVMSQFPDANAPIPFNHNAWHVVDSIAVSGGKYQVQGNYFVLVSAASGSHTLNYSFCLSCSGYTLIAQ